MLNKKNFTNETKLITKFEAKAIHPDRDKYPYRTVGPNPGIARGIEIRSNY